MPLPDTGTVAVQGGSTDSRPAYLLKVPELVWQKLESAAASESRVKVSLDGGLSFLLPGGEEVALQAHTTGAPTEVHLYKNDALTPYALANARLSAPISATTSGRIGDKVKTTNGLPSKIIKPNGLPAKPVAALAATSMSRTQSSPVGTVTSSPATTPVVPLKTRVVQLLALGPCEESEMMRKVGGAEEDVKRVVNVVGRKISTFPSTYELQPSQYSKIKIGGWKYSTSEKRIVIERARKAFDELKLPPEADERIEMDQKEAEALSSSASSTNSIASEQPSQTSVASSARVPPAPVVTAPKHALPPKPKVNTIGADSDSKSSKNGTNKKSAIGRQLDKFRAERRTTSLPNGKRENGVASPRMSSTASLASTKGDDLPAKPATTKARTIKKVDKPSKAVSTARRRSRDYTSSEKSEEEDSLPTPKKSRTSPKSASQSQKPLPTSSSSERGRSSKRLSPEPPRRKTSPAELKLKANGHASATTMSPPAKSPEDMRERYEELYPAYQQLAQKLMVVYQTAEDAKVDGGPVVAKEEVDKMVARWQKWHAELEGIRACFGDEGA